jgi:hypothetical protein
MKQYILAFAAILFLGHYSIAQKETITFNIDELDKSELSFSRSDQGTYKDDEKSNQIIVTENRIISRSYTVHTIPKEVVTETSTYMVRGNYLHGFYKNGDSVKVLLEDDIYFFVYKEMLDLVGGTTNGVFKKITDDEYILYTLKKDKTYQLSYLTLKGNKVLIKKFNADTNSELVLATNKISKKGNTNVVTPSFNELKSYIQEGLFVEDLEFKK